MIFDEIPAKNRDLFLKDLLEYVVEKNGLASIPKSDMEACFVYLYKKYVNKNCDLYTLSKKFKIKESKLKGLMELFLLKFNDDNKPTDEDILLDILLNAKFQIESVEKVEVNFHFSKIEYVPIIKNYFRLINGSVNYNINSESIIVNQNRLYDVLDYIWKQHKKDEIKEDSPKWKIQKIIGLLGNSIDDEIRNKLRESDVKKKSNLRQIIDYASKLAGIGSFVMQFYQDVLHPAS